MNQLRVNDIADAQARKMIAKHPECRMQAICSFILANALRAHSLQELLRCIPFATPSRQVHEYRAIIEKLIMDDFRRAFGHDMIAPPGA